jgi:hypothetical protein
MAGLSLPMASVTFDDLENLRRDLHSETNTQTYAIGSALTVSTGLTVGYVMWMIRGGMLLTGLLAQLPTWSVLDPLVVLSCADAADDDSLEDRESLEGLLSNTEGEEEPGKT